MFKRFQYVLTVYREQSFTRAAEKLFISQPSLSAAIKKTEEEIGTPLFERGTPVRLTAAGKEYIRVGEQITRLQHDFSAFLEDQDTLARGTLSISGSNYACSYILPRLVSRFSDAFPNVSVSLLENNTLGLQELLQSDETDLMVDSFEVPPETLTCYSLRQERIMLAVHRDRAINEVLKDYRITPEQIYHQLPHPNEPISIKYFENEKFILLKAGHDMHRQAMRAFKRSDISPQIIFSLDQLMSSYALAASGVGVAFVSDTLLRYHSFPNEVYLYPILESEPRTLSIAHKKSRYCSRAMQEFIKVAQETIQ